MKPISVSLLVFLCFTLTPVHSQPGSLISVTGPLIIPKEIIYDSLLSAAGDLSPDLIRKVLHANYDVKAYKILYSTTDLQGNEVNASGALFLPSDPEAAKPLVTYLHGTLTRDLDAPSGLTGTETVIGWMFAMNGYHTIMPDYLGMGDGPGLHPYLHSQTEASATVDMIKACKAFFQQENIPYLNDLYLCGYSQGGHAAVATQQNIESASSPVVNLKINIAGSGPYYLSYIQKKFTFGNENYENPSFLPYLLTSYQSAYGNLYESLSQIYVSPYDVLMPSLFDGSLTVSEIDSYLPAAWRSMFQPAYVSGILGNYFHPANRALRANDLVRRKPVSKLRLYYTTGDELVDKDNSIAAWLIYVLQGATDVVALPVGNYRHAGAATYVIFLAKSTFDCLSGVNPCPVDITGQGSGKAAETDEMTDTFMQLLRESDRPDPWEYLAQPQYAGLLSEVKPADEANRPEIFPQPASDKAWIDLSSLQGENIIIRCYDMAGQIVFYDENIRADGLYSIDCNRLGSGIYVIAAEGSRTYRARMAVKR